ncbi:MAG: hypothetical protein IPF64_18010 [Flavobacteriales bacterium]|nr:hypothetical protein [Flavobacteriales bacterium]
MHQVNAQPSSFLRIVVQLVPDTRIDIPFTAAEWETYLKSVPVEEAVARAARDCGQSKNGSTWPVAVSLIHYYGIRALYERLGKYNITAPFDGCGREHVGGTRYIRHTGNSLEQFISPGSLELETAIGAGELTLRVHISDTLRLTSTEGPGTWRGHIIRAGENIDASTQTVKLFVQVDGKDLRDGQYLARCIEASALSDVVAVPRSALLEDGSLYTVKDSALVKMPVESLRKGLSRPLCVAWQMVRWS